MECLKVEVSHTKIIGGGAMKLFSKKILMVIWLIG